VLAPLLLDHMTDVMTHRGPDDRGTHEAPGVALGVRRLSIVDVEGGHQPVFSEDGTVVAIHNGELYNHDELRASLRRRGHVFASRCDTEVLPHLYEEHGAGFQTHLRGMFGLAVWDAARSRAVIARDRLGIKPLYWARRGDLVVFASELKSLLASGLIEPELDYDAIASFLTLGFFPGPLTPLAGVHKLPPGCRLVIEDGDCRTERYWSYPLPAPAADRDSAEHAERLLDALEESVRMRLMADVPVGAMLSGGIDSSLIVALMARNSSRPVETFSIGFAGARDANELEDARLVASLFGTRHHELELRFDEVPVTLEELVWSLDEPLADISALGFHALSELAAQHVKVALSGQGADEQLGGYRKHRVAAVAASWGRLPRPLRAPAALAARHGRNELRRFGEALGARTPEARLLAMSAVLTPELRGQLFAGPLAGLDGREAERTVAGLCLDLPPREHPLSATLYVDGQLALVDDMLHYFDRASMAHSLEVRVPFLDHEVVELCATIPPQLKVRGTTTKYVLKRAARGLLPDRIVDKPKIGFFHFGSASVDGWFEAHANAALTHYLLDPGARSAHLLDGAVVRELVASRRASRLLVSLLVLEIWLSTFLPRALRHPQAERERVAVA
jgi:asparagine synthase (glutamine-hydrolysing)